MASISPAMTAEISAGFAFAGAGIDAQEAAVLEAVGKGIDGIAKAALLARFLEQARGGAAAQRRGINLGHEIIRIGIGQAGKGKGDMRLLQILDFAKVAAGIARRRARRHGALVQAGAFFFRQRTISSWLTAPDAIRVMPSSR